MAKKKRRGSIYEFPTPTDELQRFAHPRGDRLDAVRLVDAVFTPAACSMSVVENPLAVDNDRPDKHKQAADVDDMCQYRARTTPS